MADAEIEIKATADAAEAQQQLERTAAAIERVAVAVQDAAERLRTFDLSPLSEALASFESSAARTKSLSGAVSGWRDEVEGAKASAEATVDAIGDLSLRLEDVAQGLRDGSMSSEQAIAATQKIRDEYKALSTESQEFRQAVRELYGDLQSASAVAAAAAEKEGQAAEKSLQKIEQASERKRRARELEAQSAEALREKLEALRSEEEAARSSGNMPAAADAAQQAAAVEQALQRRSAAEQRAADREEQIASRRQTRLSLEGKSYVELARHLKALVAAREEAAQAGDGEAYDQLTAQIKGTRAAVEDLTTRTNIARTAMLGKAQAGMMVADQMGQLANGFRDGSVSAAGFATTIMSVGMAIKAGLGPIGWAMAAVQALQMAWDYFSSRQQQAEEAMKKADAAMKELNKTVAENARAIAEATERHLEYTHQLKLNRASDAAKEEMTVLKRKHEFELQAAEENERKTRDRVAAERELLNAQVQAGKLTADEYERQSKRLDEQLEEAQQQRLRISARQKDEELKLEQKSAGEAVRLAQEKYDALRAYQQLSPQSDWTRSWSDREAEYMEAMLFEFDRLTGLAKGKQAEVDSIDAKMEALKRRRSWWKYFGYEDEYQRRVKELREEREAAKSELASLNDQQSELDTEAEEIFAARFEGARHLDEAQKLRGIDMLKFTKAATAQREEAERELDEARRFNDDVEAQHALHQKELEQYDEVVRNIEAMNAGTQAEALAEENRRREREWADVSRKSLAEQESWLRRQLDGMKEGSERWQEYNSRLEGVLSNQISADLDRLLGYTQTSVSYSQRDTRTRAEILSSDRALLKARLSELRQAQLSAQEAGAGPETIKQINEKMRATRNALSGLEQSAREAAIEVLRSLNKDKEGASVDLVAMLRRDQNKVDRAAEKIARQADAAARYLDAAATARRAGDQDAEERYYAAYERRIAGMQKLGASVDRMTVTGDMGTSEVQRLLGNLRIQEQVQMRRNRAGLRLADSEERQAQRAQRDAAASRVQAPARPGGAEAAPAPAAQEEQYRAEVAQLRQAAELLREQNRQMGGFVTQCTRALGDMAASCRAMADQLATATGQIAAVQQQMRNVNASVRATARGSV